MVNWLLQAGALMAADRRGSTAVDYVVIAGMIAVIIAAILFAFGGSVTAAGV